MFFWNSNSLAFSMIQWMLSIWSLLPLPFQNQLEHLVVHSSHIVEAWLEKMFILIYIHIYFNIKMFIFKTFIYLAALGLSCGMHNLWSSLWHEGCLVAIGEIFTCGIWTVSYGMWDLILWPGIRPGPPVWGAWILAAGPPGCCAVLIHTIMSDSVRPHGL